MSTSHMQTAKKGLQVSEPFGLQLRSGQSMNIATSATPGAKQHHAQGTTFRGVKVASLSIATDGAVTTLTDRSGKATAYDAGDFEMAARAAIVQRAKDAGITDIPSWLLA